MQPGSELPGARACRSQACSADASTAPDREVKERHRKLWALGDDGTVGGEVVPKLGTALVAEAGILPGDRVLDVAAGTGNAAIPAALAGASVTAVDLTPGLLEAGRDAAGAGGVELEWVQGDAECLPFGDGSLDTVVSCVGVMFTPNHGRSAAELSRVCKPGGTVALLNWTPDGFRGDVRHHARLPADAASRLQQSANVGQRGLCCVTPRRTGGRPVHPPGHPHRGPLFGARPVPGLLQGQLRPTMGVYRGLGGDAERTAALDRGLSGLAERHARSTYDGIAMGWEYLLLRGTGRGGQEHGAWDGGF